MSIHDIVIPAAQFTIARRVDRSERATTTIQISVRSAASAHDRKLNLYLKSGTSFVIQASAAAGCPVVAAKKPIQMIAARQRKVIVPNQSSALAAPRGSESSSAAPRITSGMRSGIA